MGTVVEKYQYLEGTKQAIKKAIKNKGVDVSDTDTFRSYAEKIKEIGSGSGGGSSVAEYKFIKTGGLATYPEKPYVEGDAWFFSNADDYKNASNKLNVYCYNTGVKSFFDGDDSTGYSNSSSTNRLYFNFDGKPLKKIILLVENTHYNKAKITLYGTNDISYATNKDSGAMNLVYELEIPSNTTKSLFEIDNNSDYKYWGLQVSDSRTSIYSLSFTVDSTVIKVPLQSTNIIPVIKGYSEYYMQVETPLFYYNNIVIDSQTLTFKPYADGGCLVNYADDGKAVNLKMYLMTGANAPIYVLAPDDDFTLDGYEGKTQVADLNIPAHIYFNGTDWVMGE